MVADHLGPEITKQGIQCSLVQYVDFVQGDFFGKVSALSGA
jgi:hypothetical protein